MKRIKSTKVETKTSTRVARPTIKQVVKYNVAKLPKRLATAMVIYGD